MAGRRVSATELQYLKDVEEVRYPSCDEDDDDDDDEPKLQIDLSGAEDESTDQGGGNSNSSSNTNAARLITEGGPNNPLKSLQNLVHSPFLIPQISSTGFIYSHGSVF